MNIVKQLCAPLLMLSFFSGCAFEINPKLSDDVARFSEGVNGLVVVIEAQFEATENANRAALLDNLTLQFDLGGAPEIKLPRLFSSAERAARQTLLQALQIYANRLTKTLSGSQLSQVVQQGILTAENLRNLRPETLDLSHSMDRFQTQDIVSSLSGFSQILLSPKRNGELIEIAREVHPYIEQLALLLYLDMGAPEDQKDSCRFTALKTEEFERIEQVSLCKGGLRGLMATAIASDTVTWRQRIKLLALEKPVNKEARSKNIKHLLALQKSGQQQDDAMQQTQRALLGLVAAHKDLSVTIAGELPPDGSAALSSPQGKANPVALFSDIVDRLKVLILDTGSLFSTEFAE